MSEHSDTPRDHDSATAAETEARRLLSAYRPKRVPAEIWAGVVAPATDLVLRAGPVTRSRVEKDIQLVADVVAHLTERGQSVTLDAIVSDATLASYDVALQASNGTRENKRGILRRLQAAHHGLPWRATNRAAGERAAALAPRTEVDNLRRVLMAARADVGNPDAAAFVAVVSAPASASEGGHAELNERRVTGTPEWSAARAYAAGQNWRLTQRVLRACHTHQVLDLDEPIAVLIHEHGLTRRDLDHALSRVRELPDTPDTDVHAQLRGKG